MAVNAPARKRAKLAAAAATPAPDPEDTDDVKAFPTTATARQNWINPKTNKPVTEFQFRVYDLCAQIPAGFFSTYKAMARKLGSHPRAVGQALRHNPFCPLPVPCHRVVASDFFIGGYSGAWGSGPTIDRKRKRLTAEGVAIDLDGHIAPSLREKAFCSFS